MAYSNTRQAADQFGIKPTRLAKAVWDGRVDPPAKSPSGTYLWTLRDIERASWALLRRAYEPAEVAG